MGNPAVADSQQRSPTAIITPGVHKVKYGPKKVTQEYYSYYFHILLLIHHNRQIGTTGILNPSVR
jgi:hypothetical protein